MKTNANLIGTRLLGGVLTHVWSDGRRLTALCGGAADADDTEDDDELTEDNATEDVDGDDDASDDAPANGRKHEIKPHVMDPNDDPDEYDAIGVNSKNFVLRRASRQAAKYRVTAKANLARAESAEVRAESAESRAETAEARSVALLGELAFVKAARSTFIDTDAAWKLADRSLIEIDDDGNVMGADAAVKALVESHPFTVAPEPEPERRSERNPFIPMHGGKPTIRPKKPGTAGPSDATLGRKYPALRNR